MTTLYVLVVDKAWAKLYKTAAPGNALSLVYHQALFGARTSEASADEELARSLCRLLRADRQTGKFDRLVMLASANMLEALRRQYDGDWHDASVGRIDSLPVRYTDEDISSYVAYLLAQRSCNGAPSEGTPVVMQK